MHREEALAFEREHYSERVQHYEEKVPELERELELKKESLKILLEVHEMLNDGFALSLLQHDINSCKEEIVELQKELSRARSSLKAFEAIQNKLLLI